MITAYNHTSFTVADMDRSVRFWTGAMGFRAASVSPRSGSWQAAVTGVEGAEILVAHLHGHGLHLELIQYVGGGVPGRPIDPNMPCAAHLCFEVADIETTWRGLINAGATRQGEIATVTDGAVKGARAGYLRDPDGIVIELVELPVGIGV